MKPLVLFQRSRIAIDILGSLALGPKIIGYKLCVQHHSRLFTCAIFLIHTRVIIAGHMLLS